MTPIRIALDTSGLSDEQARRLRFAASYFEDPIADIADWVFRSKESSNFTYDLKIRNKQNLASTIGLALGKPFDEIWTYIAEIDGDKSLRDYVITRAKSDRFMDLHDETCLLGRRIGWYAFARALKPKVIVETGVDKGLGSVTLCAALARNNAEGSSGKYYGTDIMPQAGYLLAPPYSRYGEILYGDSIETLTSFDQKIDLFINDSDHSADYERREYEVIQTRLSEHAFVLGDNGYERLFAWSGTVGRTCIYFREEPLGHWHPGAGIAISLPNDHSEPSSGETPDGTQEALRFRSLDNERQLGTPTVSNLLDDFRSVEGMMSEMSARVWLNLLSWQVGQVPGDMLEIGTYKGKSAILLAGLLQPTEKLHLIDIAPYLETERFQRFGDRVQLHIGHSENLPSLLPDYALLRGRIRFVHSDASHTFQNVRDDLRSADALLHPRGIAVVDDYENPNYPQVAAAVSYSLFVDKADFRPFLMANNKLYLCRPEEWREHMIHVRDTLTPEIAAWLPMTLARTDRDEHYSPFTLRPKTTPDEEDRYGESIWGHLFQV